MSFKKYILQFAIHIAKTAGGKTLTHFQKKIIIDRKRDDSPVTLADKEAEIWMRQQIKSQYPDHGIIGEEYGTTGENKSVKWIIDPIDGTQSFIHGIPLFTTLVGITIDEKPEIGVIYSPVTKELCEAGIGLGTRLNGSSCRVSDTDTFRYATLLSTDVTSMDETGCKKVFSVLLKKCRLHRTWGDAYGHMMVAAGRADIMFDAALNIWDAAPILPIMEEAGGQFLDFSGFANIYSGQGFSTNKKLVNNILEIFKQYN